MTFVSFGASECLHYYILIFLELGSNKLERATSGKKALQNFRIIRMCSHCSGFQKTIFNERKVMADLGHLILDGYVHSFCVFQGFCHGA